MSTTPTFAESKGLESNQVAKSLAKEKAAREKANQSAKTIWQTFYTETRQKIKKLTFKPRGVYSEYVGSLEKKTEAVWLKDQIKKWKDDGIFIYEHEVQAKFAEYQKSIETQLAEKASAALEKSVEAELRREEIRLEAKAKKAAAKKEEGI